MSTQRDRAPTDGGNDLRLPASLETVWGVHPTPRKGPKPSLTVERIVAAACDIAAAEGLSAVSMGRVATDLGSSAMSLYRYIASKDELLVLMSDAAFGRPPTATSPRDGWRKGLTQWATGCLAAYRRSPWALGIPISGPPITPNAIAWLEFGLHVQRATPLSESEKASVVLLLSGFVRNAATLETDLRASMSAATPEVDDIMAGYGQLLRRLTDPTRFPALHRLLSTEVFDRSDPPDDEFEFGLERILDGIDTLVRARRR